MAGASAPQDQVPQAAARERGEDCGGLVCGSHARGSHMPSLGGSRSTTLTSGLLVSRPNCSGPAVRTRRQARGLHACRAPDARHHILCISNGACECAVRHTGLSYPSPPLSERIQHVCVSWHACCWRAATGPLEARGSAANGVCTRISCEDAHPAQASPPQTPRPASVWLTPHGLCPAPGNVR